MELDVPVWRQELCQKKRPGVLGPVDSCLSEDAATAQTQLYGEPWGNNETSLQELGVAPDAVLSLHERRLRDDADIEKVVVPREPRATQYEGPMSIRLVFSDPDNVVKLEVEP